MNVSVISLARQSSILAAKSRTQQAFDPEMSLGVEVRFGSKAPFGPSVGYFRSTPRSGHFQSPSACLKGAINRHMRPQINPADAKSGPDDALGRFFPIASPRDPAAHARLLALRGAETNFRVRNCRRFHLKALDHLVLLIVFLL